MTKKLTLEKLARIIKDGFRDSEQKSKERFEGVGEKLVSLAEEMDERFKKVDERFDKVDATMEHIRLEAK